MTRIIAKRATIDNIVLHSREDGAVWTGMVTPQFRSEVLSAGCDDCLYKPIDFERLEKLVKALTPSAPRHNVSAHSVITGQTW